MVDLRAVLDMLDRAVVLTDPDGLIVVWSRAAERLYGWSEHGDAISVTVSCAGHPMPVHVSRAGSTRVGAPGTLLGVFDDIVGRPTTITLAPGDVLVFHTDGATDVAPPHDPDDAEWTLLVSEAVRNGADAEDMADRIHAGIESILPFSSAVTTSRCSSSSPASARTDRSVSQHTSHRAAAV